MDKDQVSPGFTGVHRGSPQVLASHQVAVQSVKAMPENQVPQIWGESVTQLGTPDVQRIWGMGPGGSQKRRE